MWRHSLPIISFTEAKTNMEQQSTLKGKLDIRARLHIETGLHIGSSSDFAPIGAVDSPFVRDPLSRQPIIPGSSLKGKIRTLLVRSMTEGYDLHEVEYDSDEVRRLFGAALKGKDGGEGGGKAARLQFFDLRMSAASVERFAGMELETYIGEIKWENTINRITAAANPRQIECVPAGAEFDFRLVYNIEHEDEVAEDMALLGDGLHLLQMDYLGGHGSRGYGRVSLHDFTVSYFSLSAPDALTQEKLDEIAAVLSKGGQTS